MQHLILLVSLSLVPLSNVFSWGFYGHKLINKSAVFTLPPEMFGFYKLHSDYLSEHAIDPDKRRYSNADEACRHYIDLDYYEKVFPIDTVPQRWKDAVEMYSEDTLLAYGIVPWHVQKMLYRLTEAFKNNDYYAILHYSADIGHYMADACVPLHATMNYNGQLTNQQGIHGFWESRLAELFSNQYDLFTGNAYYLHASQKKIWEACEGSYLALDSVLTFEHKLSTSFDDHKKYVLEKKGNQLVKNYSLAYAKAYHQQLNGMVERRICLAIQLVGCLWYTAWVDAGQPDLTKINPDSKQENQLQIDLEKITEQQPILGRPE